MEPIRRLTKKDVDWEWSDEQDMAFNKVKKLVTEAPILSYYDPTHELEIQCSANQRGLGAALLQGGRPIAYTSRALTDTEEQYAQREGNAGDCLFPGKVQSIHIRTLSEGTE